ncbi:MAG: hypothetical protein GY699_15710 [Desulfobacteraceae bacterium]|nr:hypothetical protein [Desulfobacteraceae bacterium]
MTGMAGLECWGAECWGADCWGADCIDWMESPDMGYTRQPMYRPMQRRISRRRY